MSTNCLVTKLNGSVSGNLPIFDTLRLYANAESNTNVAAFWVDGSVPVVIDGDGYFTNAGGDNLGKEITISNTSIYSGASFYVSAGEFNIYIRDKHKVYKIEVSNNAMPKIETEDVYGMNLQLLITTNLSTPFNFSKYDKSLETLIIWGNATGHLERKHLSEVADFQLNSLDISDGFLFNVIDAANPHLVNFRTSATASGVVYCTIEEFILEIIRQQREAGSTIGGTITFTTGWIMTLNGTSCYTYKSTLTFTEHHITITNSNPSYNYEADI